jgi:8-hydroxy-5-deazaflavin:NADPH oxidoreductase
MRFGVLGTGMVGHAVAGKLVDLGHDVMMGARQAGNEKAVKWARESGGKEGSFADAAAFGEIVVNGTGGTVSLQALEAAGAENLAGKIVIDISNPLEGPSFPRTLSVCNTDSVGEQIQRAFPEAKVVKALNTVNISVMVHPENAPGNHVMFMSGNDADAKQTVLGVLGEIGWPAERVLDLGDITAARGQEMYLPLWMLMVRALGTATFNIEIRRG